MGSEPLIPIPDLLKTVEHTVYEILISKDTFGALHGTVLVTLAFNIRPLPLVTDQLTCNKIISSSLVDPLFQILSVPRSCFYPFNVVEAQH